MIIWLQVVSRQISTLSQMTLGVGVGVEIENCMVHSGVAALGLETGAVGAIGLGPAFWIRKAIARVMLPTAIILRKSMASKALFCFFCGSILIFFILRNIAGKKY